MHDSFDPSSSEPRHQGHAPQASLPRHPRREQNEPDIQQHLSSSIPHCRSQIASLSYLQRRTADTAFLPLEMAPAYLAQCANCGTDATMRCVNCMDAPEYHPGDSVGSVYCNRDCQKRHWSNHKAYCKARGQRKKLLRTAQILKAALLTYREVMYDVDLTKIELQDGVLYLHQNQRPITTRSKRGLFPDHLTTSIDHKEAALAKNQCTTAMALLGRLTRKLLAGEIDPQDCHLGKLGFTFSRGSLNHRSIGYPYWEATDSSKARSWSRLQRYATHSVKSGTTVRE